MMKFELRKSSKQQFYWVLKARNGEPICFSEGYAHREDAIHSINLVKMGSLDAAIHDLTKESKG